MAKIKNWLAKPGEWLDKQGKNLVFIKKILSLQAS